MEHLTGAETQSKRANAGTVEPIQLKVSEAYHRDAGKGIARLSLEVMNSMGVNNGDVIQISGKEKVVLWPGRETSAIHWISSG